MTASTRSVKRAFRHNPQSSTTPSQPSFLASSIQTSLLSVGMRVRKSVSDGYQNAPKTAKSINIQNTAQTRDGSRSNQGTNGLLPYCGILRTGNLQQENLGGGQDEVPALDWDTDDFPSSQESTASTSIFSGSNAPQQLPNTRSAKRRYEDEDSEGLLHPNPLGLHPPQQIKLPFVNALRPMLQPKTRRNTRMITGQEKGASVIPMEIDEFEEADFLRFDDFGQENGCY